MRRINFKDVEVAYLTSTKFPERDKDTKEMLDKLGVEAHRFDGGVTDPYTIGVATGHLQALSSLSMPCLLLEDDARLAVKMPEFSSVTMEIPDNAQALYLGTSQFGRIENKTALGGVICSRTQYNWVHRVYNMLSMHAVIYLCDEYKKHITTHLEAFIKNPPPDNGVDDFIADTMHRFQVYAVSRPLFFQQDGHSDQVTLAPLMPKI